MNRQQTTLTLDQRRELAADRAYIAARRQAIHHAERDALRYRRTIQAAPVVAAPVEAEPIPESHHGFWLGVFAILAFLVAAGAMAGVL